MLVPATSAMICSSARMSTLWNDSEMRSPVYTGASRRRASIFSWLSGCSSITN
jgi:hypothetical protein